ncbi:hypothetical protein HanIR_Chr17g0852821 [Helianthus annuus]|nr:hypothetical protein HanIR_Chr17g0852821 [Helianthus annuus]
MTGLPVYLTHSRRYGSDKFFGSIRFWTWRFSESIPVYSMTGLFPGRIVAEPDQQLMMSKGSVGAMARSSGVQLIKSCDTECAQYICSAKSGPDGLY